MILRRFKKNTISSTSTQNNKTSPELIFLRWKRRIKIIILSLVFVFTSLSLGLWWVWEEPLVSPVTSFNIFRFLAEPDFPITGNKIVYGFVPYWTMNNIKIQPEMTHLGYFSLTLNADGSFVTREESSAEPGYHRLNSESFLDLSTAMHDQGGQVELVITQFLGNDIRAFLGSLTAQERFITALDNVLLAYPFSGINIDIELNGSADQRLRDQFTDFMILLRSHLNQKYDHIQLSVDVYAGAASNQQLWDIEKIEPHVDYIIVMAYDFHRRSSPQAGPVAPLFGGNELWDSDINQHLHAFLKLVPPEKILLGIPFYGYEWQTTSRNAQSHTFPETGATASVERVNQILRNKNELKVEEHWNDQALSPYISYEKDGEIFVIYFENSRSISYKLDYVNQLDLGGIAIWAIGYEGESRELWEVIERKIR